MTTQWNIWKNTLSAQQKGPHDLTPATRGQFYQVPIIAAGDLTAATLTGSVRSSPDSTSTLAVFSVAAPTFADGKTTWVASLAEGSGANSTGSLPVDGDGNGVEQFPYDFLLKFPGEKAERLFGGLLPVSGHITEPTA